MTKPPERRGYLAEMVRLVTADKPDVVCLQELPVWAVSRLEGWSGMTAVSAVARRPRLGSAELARLNTQLNQDAAARAANPPGVVGPLPPAVGAPAGPGPRPEAPGAPGAAQPVGR